MAVRMRKVMAIGLVSVCHLLTFCFAKNNITDKRRTWPGFGSSRRAEGHFGMTVLSTAYQIKCFIYLFYFIFFWGGGGRGSFIWHTFEGVYSPVPWTGALG